MVDKKVDDQKTEGDKRKNDNLTFLKYYSQKSTKQGPKKQLPCMITKLELTRNSVSVKETTYACTLRFVKNIVERSSLNFCLQASEYWWKGSMNGVKGLIPAQYVGINAG